MGDTQASARHAGAMVAATVTVAGLNYGLNILLGWALPLSAYGQVGVIQTILFLGTWLLGAGLPGVVSRAIAQARGGEASGAAAGREVWQTVKTAWLANSALAGIVVAAFAGSYLAGWLPLGADYAPLIAPAALTIGALGISAVPDAAMQGLFRFGTVARWRVLEAVTNVALSAALLALGFGAAGALGGFAAAAVLALALNVWSLRDTHLWHVPGWVRLRSLGLAGPLAVAAAGSVLLTNLDVLAIKALTGAATADALVGTYSVAAVLARAPLFVSQALVATYYPRVAQEPTGPAAGELRRWLALSVLPMNVILLAAAPAVVAFFFPPRFAGAATPLAVLALSSAALAWAGGEAAIAQARGRAAWPARILALAVVAQVAALALLVPAVGLVGASLASAGATLLAAGGLALVAGRIVWPELRPVRLTVVLAALALLLVPLGLLGDTAGRGLTAVWIAMAAAAYVMACLLLNLVHVPPEGASRGTSPGGLGSVVDPLLDGARLLNRIGSRFGAAAP